MTQLNFTKYQGTGNDFIMIDNRMAVVDPNNHTLIIKLCDRKFGIGADGLILIQNHPEYDFEMIYFNADASQSMCGNGSRCAVHFARQLKLIGNSCRFLAIDGPHEATIKGDIVKLKMGDVGKVDKIKEDYFVNTGSPHYVRLVDDIHSFPVFEEGKFIRNSERYKKEGTNVNFVELRQDNEIFVRTYERGVENETLSCGTGVTACSLAVSLTGYRSPVKVSTLGGDLEVSFEKQPDNAFKQVYLSGPAQEVFQGTVLV